MRRETGDSHEIVSVLDHVSEGCGVRKTSRLTGVHRDTVLRYSLLAGEHAKDLHDVLVAFSPSDARGAVRREVGLRGQKADALIGFRGLMQQRCPRIMTRF